MDDHYRTLGVSRTATPDKIKAAYRHLARATHPDHHSGDKRKEQRLKEINVAYGVLSDPALRAEYDRRFTPPEPPPVPRPASNVSPQPPRRSAPPESPPTPQPGGGLMGLFFTLASIGVAYGLQKAKEQRGRWDPGVDRRRGPDGRFRPT